MGFDFNSVLNTDIDNNIYIDTIQWNLILDNLFYMLCSNKVLKLYGTEITRDETNNIDIIYTDDENYKLILQFKNDEIKQLVPYVEVINFYPGKISNEDRAENICNFLTIIFNIIKEYELIPINRIFIKPEIED